MCMCFLKTFEKLVFFSYLFLPERVTASERRGGERARERERDEDLSFTGSLSKWMQWPGTSWSETGSQELHSGTHCGCRV